MLCRCATSPIGSRAGWCRASLAGVGQSTTRRPASRRRGRLRLRGRGRRRSRGRRGGVPSLARHVAVAAHRDHVPRARAALTRGATSSPRSSRRSTARCPPTRWVRSPAASRTSSSPAASRSCSRAGSASRPPAASTSTRSASRSASWRASRPFNFPAMVPMWMFANAIACGNTFMLKPSEKDPSRLAVPGGAAARGRRPRRACSTSCRATRSRSTRSSTTPTSQAVSFVGSTPIARYIYETGTATASASRRSAAPRTTWSCCPMPTSTWRPTPP